MATCPTCRAIQAILMAGGLPPAEADAIASTPTVRSLDKKARKVVKRKATAYQKEFGRQLKKLKAAHPRTPVTRLMKRAHSATKRARR
jgi:hypothetical protein